MREIEYLEFHSSSLYIDEVEVNGFKDFYVSGESGYFTDSETTPQFTTGVTYDLLLIARIPADYPLEFFAMVTHSLSGTVEVVNIEEIGTPVEAIRYNFSGGLQETIY